MLAGNVVHYDAVAVVVGVVVAAVVVAAVVVAVVAAARIYQMHPLQYLYSVYL